MVVAWRCLWYRPESGGREQGTQYELFRQAVIPAKVFILAARKCGIPTFDQFLTITDKQISVNLL